MGGQRRGGHRQSKSWGRDRSEYGYRSVIPRPEEAVIGPTRYVWRDPARVSAERLAELEAHDARLRAQGAEAGAFEPGDQV